MLDDLIGNFVSLTKSGYEILEICSHSLTGKITADFLLQTIWDSEIKGRFDGDGVDLYPQRVVGGMEKFIS